ncbi:MAG: hypothetical protein R2706_02325 [Acidimicrobiales bacterium]
MLQSPEVDDQITRAAEAYQYRREGLTTALASHGIVMPTGVGLNLWVPVVREDLATIGLAAAGIGVAPGEPFRVSAGDDHLRVTSAHVRDHFDAVAEAIAGVATIAGTR